MGENVKPSRARAKLFNMVSTGVIDEPINKLYDAISIIALALNLFAAFAITFKHVFIVSHYQMVSLVFD